MYQSSQILDKAFECIAKIIDFWNMVELLCTIFKEDPRYIILILMFKISNLSANYTKTKDDVVIGIGNISVNR